MDDATPQEGLTDDQLAEAEAQSDLVDADIEDADTTSHAAAREPIEPNLSEEDLVEAEVESDLVDADIEDA